jgi:importin subunit beta-1
LSLIQHPRSETNRQKPEILSLRSNEILSAVIHGARKEEPSSEVQLAAIHALFNSLEFVRDNFEREVGQNSLLL